MSKFSARDIIRVKTDRTPRRHNSLTGSLVTFSTPLAGSIHMVEAIESHTGDIVVSRWPYRAVCQDDVDMIIKSNTPRVESKFSPERVRNELLRLVVDGKLEYNDAANAAEALGLKDLLPDKAGSVVLLDSGRVAIQKMDGVGRTWQIFKNSGEPYDALDTSTYVASSLAKILYIPED